MSRLTRSLFAAVLGLCLVAGSARASQVVFGNLGSDGSGGSVEQKTSITGSQWLAQGFSTGASSTSLFIDDIVLALAAPSGSISTSISIWSNSSSAPSSLLYSSSSLSVAGATRAKYTFSFGGAALTANTSYWVVLQQPNIDWHLSSAGSAAGQNSSGYTSNGAVSTTNSGGSWSSDFLGGFSAISITASSTGPEPIPEPGTWAAAALLIGAAAYVRWRRRPQAA